MRKHRVRRPRSLLQRAIAWLLGRSTYKAPAEQVALRAYFDSRPGRKRVRVRRQRRHSDSADATAKVAVKAEPGGRRIGATFSSIAQRGVAIVAALLLLLPVPAYAGFIVFNSWSLNTSNGLATFDGIGTTGNPDGNNVIYFSPTQATNSNGSLTLDGSVGQLTYAGGSHLFATLASSLSAGSLTVTFTDIAPAGQTGLGSITANNSNNQFSANLGQVVNQGDTLRVNIAFNFASTTSTPYSITFNSQ